MEGLAMPQILFVISFILLISNGHVTKSHSSAVVHSILDLMKDSVVKEFKFEGIIKTAVPVESKEETVSDSEDISEASGAENVTIEPAEDLENGTAQVALSNDTTTDVVEEYTKNATTIEDDTAATNDTTTDEDTVTEDVEVHAVLFKGQFEGTCEGDGLYYNDEQSFVTCIHGQASVQPCALGSAMFPLAAYEKSDVQPVSAICGVLMEAIPQPPTEELPEPPPEQIPEPPQEETSEPQPTEIEEIPEEENVESQAAEIPEVVQEESPVQTSAKSYHYSNYAYSVKSSPGYYYYYYYPYSGLPYYTINGLPIKTV